MSESLIEEMQRSAVSSTSEVSALLRQVKFAAAKLNLDTVEQWVESELNGYQNGMELPPYRKLGGSPMVLTLYSGWQPLMLEKKLDFLRISNIGDSVAKLESMIANKEDSYVRIYPSEFITNLSKANGNQIAQAGSVILDQHLSAF